MPDRSLEQLLQRWVDITALETAAGLASWDQETMMPAKGQPGRGAMLAGLAGLTHGLLTDPSLRESAEAVAEEAEPASIEAAHAHHALRAITRADAVPAGLTRHLAELRSRSLSSWQEARAANDLTVFQPDLTELVHATIEMADALVDAGIATSRYDALLDEYEPGARAGSLTDVLDDLVEQLVPLVQAVADSGRTVDESPWLVAADERRQEALAREMATLAGYDWEAGRMDPAAHPFTCGFGPGDVRITRRFEPDDLRPGLLGTLHEVGHALYEQGLPPELTGTPAGGAASLGVHESQSRLWENHVGRSLPFWSWAASRLAHHVPDTAGVSPEQLWAGLHPVRPSLVRVEADETTYNLHIAVRFRLELALFDGDVAVADLRDAWDESYEQLVGVRPANVADGVLQDIHWSMGAFGYFPTYTIGNLMAAQLFERLDADVGSVDGVLASGDLAPILGWLRDRIHRRASVLGADDLIEEATGTPLSARPLVDHLRRNLAAAYDLSV
ncbi:MAG: carboxypeptidase M32 [Acidimicrobiia bacterium]|nr:carboxypeptidase M32 [Acidimicrobiia bacterium]